MWKCLSTKTYTSTRTSGSYYCPKLLVYGTKEEVGRYVVRHTKIVPMPSTDVEQLSAEDCERLGKFSFAGLDIKVRLLNIVDGDTFDVAVFTPLSAPRVNAKFYRRKASVEIVAIPGINSNNGFFTKQRCRILGINAVEKRDPGGFEATEYLKTLLPKYFRCKFHSNDAFGRSLVEVYVDGAKIHSKLLNYRDPIHGQIFKKY